MACAGRLRDWAVWGACGSWLREVPAGVGGQDAGRSRAALCDRASSTRAGELGVVEARGRSSALSRLRRTPCPGTGNSGVPRHVDAPELPRRVLAPRLPRRGSAPGLPRRGSAPGLPRRGAASRVAEDVVQDSVSPRRAESLGVVGRADNPGAIRTRREHGCRRDARRQWAGRPGGPAVRPADGAAGRCFSGPPRGAIPPRRRRRCAAAEAVPRTTRRAPVPSPCSAGARRGPPRAPASRPGSA
ncbi:hypothetical protein FBY22_1279 [Streptomyces sp. SLBN-31]|nr:hypothetical protein FBY22_1279 [Streptomyces sp. SLBN-31]